MLAWLLEWDESLFRWINATAHSAFLDFLLPFWRNKFNWILLYALVTAILFWKYKQKAIPILLLVALTILVTDQISSELLKKTVLRLRPCNDPLMQDHLRLLVHCGKGFSFTSSHASNHFALAYLFIQFLKPLIPIEKVTLRWLLVFGFFIWAVLVAYAQVYVGVHYPLDVMGGALLGWGLAAILYAIYKKILPAS